MSGQTVTERVDRLFQLKDKVTLQDLLGVVTEDEQRSLEFLWQNARVAVALKAGSEEWDEARNYITRWTMYVVLTKLMHHNRSAYSVAVAVASLC